MAQDASNMDQGAALRIVCALVTVSARNSWKADDWEAIPNGVRFTVQCAEYIGVVEVEMDTAHPYYKAKLETNETFPQIHLHSLYSVLNRRFTEKRKVISGLA